MSAEPIQLSKHRIEALADGIFAIVATLIVLELHFPELPRNASSSDILHALQHLGFPLFSFVVTFMLAGSFWSLHQLTMHFMSRVNGALLWLNIAFLMFVSLLPFSAGLLGRFKLTSTVPLLIYFGNQFLISLLLSLQWMYARKKGLVTPEGMATQSAREIPLRIYALTAGAGLAGVMAVIYPPLSFYGFLVPMVILRAIVKRQRRSDFDHGPQV